MKGTRRLHEAGQSIWLDSAEKSETLRKAG